MKYVLALDQGTTSSRAILFDNTGRVAGKAYQEFRQIYPRAGWVEHDPKDILGSQVGVIAEALVRAGASIADVEAVGVSNQRETTLVWDARIARSFGRQRNWIIAFTGHDLLRQISNVRRTLDALGRTETRYNTMPAYVLLSVSYHFKPRAKAAQ